MAGAICGTCHYSSTGNVEPHCGRSDCPNKNAKLLPSKLQVENLKRAFAEHDIPWPTLPKEKEIDKHEQCDFDVRRLLTMRDAVQVKITEATDTPWECSGRKQILPEPGECDWPGCGCDSHATRVISALVEQGWSKPTK